MLVLSGKQIESRFEQNNNFLPVDLLEIIFQIRAGDQNGQAETKERVRSMFSLNLDALVVLKASFPLFSAWHHTLSIGHKISLETASPCPPVASNRP